MRLEKRQMLYSRRNKNMLIGQFRSFSKGLQANELAGAIWKKNRMGQNNSPANCASKFSKLFLQQAGQAHWL